LTNVKKDWRGSIVAEGLRDPTVVNRFTIYKAGISEDNLPIDCEGHVGRWHWYDVKCSEDEIAALQPCILRGWYAHFWNDDKLIVLYHDRRFELDKNDKNTWKDAIEHGKAQGIPENELGFSTG
jgi:hypothetical protein